MSETSLHTQPYRRPMMWRGIEPQRMNWLWGLICELGQINATELVQALHASGVAINSKHARRWLVDSRDDAFFPISISELERNVRALLALRESQAADGAGEPAVEPDEAAAAAEAGSDCDVIGVDDESPENNAPEREEAVEEAPVAGTEALRDMVGV